MYRREESGPSAADSRQAGHAETLNTLHKCTLFRSTRSTLGVRRRDAVNQMCGIECSSLVSEGGLEGAKAKRCASEPVTGPLCSGEGWTIRPAGAWARMPMPPDRTQNVVSKSPASPHGPAGEAGGRGTGVASLLVTCSLAKQRKVTRPPAGGRKPAVPRGLPSVATSQVAITRTSNDNATGPRPTPG